MAGVADHSVATRLIRLCLRSDGALPRSPLLSSTTRAALLADLALSQALTSEDAVLDVDTTPTGVAAADKLLAAVAAVPDKSLDWWLRRGPDAVHDVVADLLARGVWARQLTHLSRRYTDSDPTFVASDAARVRKVLEGSKPDTPATAVLAALIGVVGTKDRPGGRLPTTAAVAGCGAARWLIPDLVDYLLARRKLLQAAATDARTALSANYIF